MKRIDAAVWAPADDMELEDRALEAVKAAGNVLVIAGPGAGKTELLAQKAGYLLQTGGCRMPRRILAISFKRDAARNLGERVEKRIGPLLAKRFHSVTFDAFAKGLLDKFRSGLPAPYQIGPNYEIMEQPKNAIENAFRAADQEHFMTHRLDYQAHLNSVPLPHAIEQGRGMEVLHQAWLNLTAKTVPEVNFQMIMRLAGLILDTNPTLRHYLQLTYSHVFLDEFQDTTELQFQFLNTCFDGSAAIFTAVGDDKQRIMGWAGAKTNIFETFVAQTAATSIALTRNFRSLPKLVNLQNYLMEKVLRKTDFATAASNRKPDEGEASVLLFSNDTYESNHLATIIEKWVLEDGIDPRKICVLVRAALKDYAATLIEILNARGIAARDENELQNLLSEDIVIFLLRVISLVVGPGDYHQMQQAFDIIIKLYPEKREDQLLKLRKDLQDFIKARKAALSEGTTSEEDLKRLVDAILEHGGIDRVKAAYPQFAQGKHFDDTIKQFTGFLWAYYEDGGDMLAAVASLEGDDTIPVMTIHKSKGLEFHTVVFIGLEDQTFWNYMKETEADNNVFFVALSRAKERVIFTFSEHRPGMHVRSQYRSWKNIIQIYTAMHESDVVEVHDFRITQ